MTSYVPAIWEPLKKPHILKKRQKRLQAAIASGNSAKVAKFAEQVRDAALAVVKAKRALLDSQPGVLAADADAEKTIERLRLLQAEEDRIRSLSIMQIIAEFAGENTPPSTFR